VEFTWSLARANVHPKADSVKGGEQLGALARWVQEHKSRKVSSPLFNCHHKKGFMPTAVFFFYLSEEQHHRGLSPRQTTIHPPLLKKSKESGTDCVSNLFNFGTKNISPPKRSIGCIAHCFFLLRHFGAMMLNLVKWMMYYCKVFVARHSNSPCQELLKVNNEFLLKKVIFV
jgi:hypothetical protein